VRAEVADRWVETEVLYNFSFRIISMQSAGLVPNDEASMGKLYSSELVQRVARTGSKVFGLYANLWDEQPWAPMQGSYCHAYVAAVPATIRGGTSEVQRNIIATRGLGLPRS
jgi:alkylation response protein AidB-like acyl-CoA dehydrogenase